MSGRQKRWKVTVSFPSEWLAYPVSARSEEEAIELAREGWEQEIVRNHLKFTAEELEEDEE